MNIGIKLGLAVVMGLALPGWGGEQPASARDNANLSVGAGSGGEAADSPPQTPVQNDFQADPAVYESDHAIIMEQCRLSDRSSQCYHRLSGVQIRRLFAGRAVTFNLMQNEPRLTRPWKMQFESASECAFVFGGHVTESECLFDNNYLTVGTTSTSYIDLFRCDVSDVYVARHRRLSDVRYYIVTVAAIER